MAKPSDLARFSTEPEANRKSFKVDVKLCISSKMAKEENEDFDAYNDKDDDNDEDYNDDVKDEEDYSIRDDEEDKDEDEGDEE